MARRNANQPDDITHQKPAEEVLTLPATDERVLEEKPHPEPASAEKPKKISSPKKPKKPKSEKAKKGRRS